MPKILFIVLCLLGVLAPSVARAQVEPPDREYLFLEDRQRKDRIKKRKKELAEKRSRAAESSVSEGALPFDISASKIDFDSSGNVIKAAGNVIISYSNLIAEASEAEVNTVSNEAMLQKNVRISDLNANLTAEKARVNLSSGDSSLEDVSLFFAEGGYRVAAEKIARDSKDTYSLEEAVMTTCACPDGDDCRPWSLFSDEASIERDGYGEAWGSSLRVYDIPVMYVPYIFFPAKTERQSGFLPATFGVGRRSGFILNLPFFWAINDSTDMTITGIYESRVRLGAGIDARKIFSRNHSLEFGGVALDESQRRGLLLGTRIDGLADPSLSEDRYAAYVDEQWTRKILGHEFQWLVDGHYVSDDLMPREIENDRIAEQDARYVTSSATLRTPIGDDFSLDLYTEYNQALVTDDDFVFQRLPQLSLSGLNFFRPFGENPYGLRTVFTHSAELVNFSRKQDYTGTRAEIYEVMKVPFFYENIIEGSISGGLRASSYSVSDQVTEVPEGEEEAFTVLPDSSDRIIPSLSGRLGTVFEGVFDAEEGNPIKFFGEMGRIAKSQELVRLKHTIEPEVSYRYVDDVDQTDNPQFDSIDRLAKRNVVTYALTQRLFGRYEPRNAYLYGLEETAPRPRDLGGLSDTGPLNEKVQFGVDPESDSGVAPLRRGTVSELATFRLAQSYDLAGRSDQIDDDRFSDLAAEVALYPNQYFRVRGKTDFDVGDTSFSGYLVESQFSTKRGDLFRSRLRFVENSIRQLETGIELGLTDRLRFGYYGRYDDEIKDFIEQRGGLRISSACDCWMLDLLVTDQTNPDNTRFSFNVTLLGLGEIGNTFFTSVSGEDTATTTR